MFAPTVTPMSDVKVRKGWVAAGALAMCGDVLSTWLALRMHMEEGNPVAAHMFERFGFWQAQVPMALLWSVLIAAAAVTCPGSRHKTFWFTTNLAGRVAIVLRWLVVLSNLWLLAQALWLSDCLVWSWTGCAA